MSDNQESRTIKQNSSLHGTLGAYAEKLNDAGCDYVAFCEAAKNNGFAVNWTKDNLKVFFDGITKAMYGGKTSSRLTKKEISDAYQVFEREINKRSGVSHAWHSLEQQMLESDNRWW